jgi:hypothetical protein
MDEVLVVALTEAPHLGERRVAADGALTPGPM